MKVGFVGLGAMGAPMAENLLQAGHSVRGFDLRAQALDALKAVGGEPAASPRDAADGVDLLLVMVVSGMQAESVLYGTDGAAQALPRDAVVVVSCTQPPAQAAALAKRLAGDGLRMLDAPVSGGVVGAKAGTLTIMVGGESATLELARPVLEVVGGRIFHIGETPGMGSTAKMINQLLCGVHIAAAAEAMHVAEKAGISTRTMHEMISVSAGNSWMWGDRGPRMMQVDPVVTSAVDIFVKDLGIVLDEGRATRQGLPLAAAAHQMFLAASGLGFGAADDSQVIRAYRALNGVEAAND
ncbi:MAG: NAD(P)-dependent oxidoreductase [Burkholderiaceae bacterium]|nr:NAD(P)-dependent oxidoreductase [Burkholderiaceae bacterium]